MNDLFSGPLSSRTQLIAIIGSLTMAVIIVILIRHNRLKPSYSILWFLVGGLLLTISIFTDILNALSSLVGIYYPPAAFFTVVIVAIIVMQIHYSIVLTQSERKIKKLAQEIALLKSKSKIKKIN